MKIVLASHNLGKIRELQNLLKPFCIQLIPQADLGVEEIEETGLTFVENALIKARHASLLTGLPAIADDSGLVVTALNGAPGIYSGRYAGPDGNANNNIRKLLLALEGVPESDRHALFQCTLVFMAYHDDPVPLICNGTWYGSILNEPRGEKGFGYDPIFYIPSEKMSAAECPLEIKNAISHRGLALQALVKKLPEKL